jgi:hypothetical protein
VVVLAALAATACSRDPQAATSVPPRVGVEVILGDTGPRPSDQHPPQTAPAPGAMAPTEGHGHGDHARGDHTASLPTSARFERQVAAARRRARSLMALRRLGEASYYVGSYYSAGVGSHYINWPLLDRPFSPDAPTMLLVDTTPGHIPRLAGFSYWVRSPQPPQGFVGDADQWHNHRGLCFVDGVLAQEDVPRPADCAGTWLDGADLWMLHAWVVPGYENPDGLFAPLNRKLCPPRRGNDAVVC